MDDKDLLLKLGYKIKYERLKRKLSQEKFAEMVGLSPQSISTLESGLSNVKFTNLYNIAKVLNLDLGDFSDFKL
jgi:Helix-turn-helix.